MSVEEWDVPPEDLRCTEEIDDNGMHLICKFCSVFVLSSHHPSGAKLPKLPGYV